jgi:hypothetical protein
VGGDVRLVEAVPGASLGQVAARPRASGLASRHVPSLGSLDQAVADFAAKWAGDAVRQPVHLTAA